MSPKSYNPLMSSNKAMHYPRLPEFSMIMMSEWSPWSLKFDGCASHQLQLVVNDGYSGVSRAGTEGA